MRTIILCFFLVIVSNYTCYTYSQLIEINQINEIIEQLEGFRLTLEKDMNLKKATNPTYIKLKCYISELCNVFGSEYLRIENRAKMDKYIKKVANQFVDEGQPIILIPGHNSESTSTKFNKRYNNLNLKLLGLNDCNLSHKNNFEFDMDIHLNGSFPGKLEMLPQRTVNGLFTQIAVQKFNEYTFLELEKRFGKKELKRIRY